MVAPVGGCDRIPRQTHPLIPTLFAQSGGDGRVCVAGSEPAPGGIVLPTHMHSQIKRHIFPQHLSHAQVVLYKHLTLPFTITVGYKVQCLVQPLFYIGLLGATGYSDGVSLPMHVCV